MKLNKEEIIKNLWSLDKIRGHKFMTKEILTLAEKIWNQEWKWENTKILVKYFLWNWTWYVTEIISNQEAFWFIKGLENELWCINLNELSKLRWKFWLPVERDCFFKSWKTLLSDIWFINL